MGPAREHVHLLLKAPCHVTCVTPCHKTSHLSRGLELKVERSGLTELGVGPKLGLRAQGFGCRAPRVRFESLGLDPCTQARGGLLG